MYCAVYRLRHRGERLEREAIRGSRSLGEPVFTERVHDPRPGRSLMVAMLLATDGESYVLPVLDHARVFRTRGRGTLIAGTEVIPLGRGIKNIRAERYRQTWWCIPALPEAVRLLLANSAEEGGLPSPREIQLKTSCTIPADLPSCN